MQRKVVGYLYVIFLLFLQSDGYAMSRGQSVFESREAECLYLAIVSGKRDKIDKILKGNIDPNGICITNMECTYLHVAVLLGRVNAVKLLLEQEGINVLRKNRLGQLPLDIAKSHILAGYNFVEIIRLLKKPTQEALQLLKKE